MSATDLEWNVNQHDRPEDRVPLMYTSSYDYFVKNWKGPANETEEAWNNLPLYSPESDKKSRYSYEKAYEDWLYTHAINKKDFEKTNGNNLRIGNIFFNPNNIMLTKYGPIQSQHFNHFYLKTKDTHFLLYENYQWV